VKWRKKLRLDKVEEEEEERRRIEEDGESVKGRSRD
jgi:hypothetical protein